MKYESELIKEIVDSRGHEKSSLHYESECIESWIEEAKGAYPKLCDYQSEWLEYISILDDVGGGEDPEPPIGGGEEPKPEPPIGEFPYETVTANNTATVNHVVPLAYKSAILYGKSESIDGTLQSVKMPVLTTTGKNLNSANNEDVKPYGINDNGTIASAGGDKHCEKFIKVPPSSKIFLSFGGNTYIKVLGYDKNKNLTRKIIRADRTFTFQTNAVEQYIRLSWNPKDTSDITKLSLTLSDYEYQPYQSNILTVNDDVELRGIGDVKDELNLMTGEVTERIGEIVLDGSLQVEGMYTQAGKTKGFYFPTNTIQLKSGQSENDVTKMVICDKFSVKNNNYQWNGEWIDEEFLSATLDGRIAIRLLATKASTKDELHQYLSQNPITVYYQAATESVKTVDLSVVNQDGEPLSKIKPIEGTMHIEVSGTPINPTAVLEVPVEAITQNLNSFIGEE